MAIRTTAVAALIVLVLMSPGSLVGHQYPTPTPTKPPPSGFSGIAWGETNTAQLYREFGQPTEREGSTYRWREVYVLDKPAQVTISMDQSHGLWEGSYAWDFPSSGTKSDDLVAFAACFHVHTGLMMSLLKSYGAPSSKNPPESGCISDDGWKSPAASLTNWDWWDSGIHISMAILWEPDSGGALMVQYNNNTIASDVRDDEAARRF